jgi:hypothetical protein
MRRSGVLILWGLASLYGFWHGIRLAFLCVAMQGSIKPDSGVVVIEPTFIPMGILVLLVLVVIYAVLGLAAYDRQYAGFRRVAGVHIALSVIAVSVGGLFWPSSAARHRRIIGSA